MKRDPGTGGGTIGTARDGTWMDMFVGSKVFRGHQWLHQKLVMLYRPLCFCYGSLGLVS